MLEAETAAMDGEIMALTPRQWEGPSNCAGWQVADLVAHVVRNGWSMLTFVKNTLANDSETPVFGPAVAHIQEEIK
ncbi:MAG: maleylpyruvate isomerase N-terminal domain-containing protein, partial [Chloroflexi bacterium]|nr:maleylpyruvate isomerase N-terminal domain-containing protein [Chloroflexota bacterium]